MRYLHQRVNVTNRPKIVVFSSLFPSTAQPTAGVFVRERMFNVAKQLDLCVVSPKPWFPFQGLLRFFKPHFRPCVSAYEVQSGIDVFQPKYFSFPSVFKRWDGFLMALGAWRTLRQLHHRHRIDLIDAHFTYPDGYAATLVGQWLGVPVTITMRGTEHRHSKNKALCKCMQTACHRAVHIFSVAEDLCHLARRLGVPDGKLQVVGNGVDLDKFKPINKNVARIALGLHRDDVVLISVGGLVERKGYHRVIEIMPELTAAFPTLRLLIVGGATAEGNNRDQLEQQVKDLGMAANVQFLGPKPHDKLADVLSAADVFVLATSNEGWANVFLEAMACGLPVVTTDVGGNKEVVMSEDYGLVVPFGDKSALLHAILNAVQTQWNTQKIMQYAKNNSWHQRVQTLIVKFKEIIHE
jgi:glycosyltransferase involved in cell wall biosynthesis